MNQTCNSIHSIDAGSKDTADPGVQHFLLIQENSIPNCMVRLSSKYKAKFICRVISQHIRSKTMSLFLLRNTLTKNTPDLHKLNLVQNYTSKTSTTSHMYSLPTLN